MSYKAKGPKCFVCSGYGHVSTKCPEKNNGSGSSNLTLVEVVPRNSVKLNIDDIHMIALLDTGSDITAIRKDVYEAYFKDIDLNGESVTLRAQVDVVFRDGEIVVFKKERHNFVWTITLDEEANKETKIVDVIHIKNEKKSERSEETNRRISS
ncbi:hypothetical protein JTB14_033255 [Gonioctena quinquepunctata]|nr:hypothetical protein JTB14_033255 [Gonioctena quinquepunctata]